MGPSALRATVRVIGPETLFGWVGICAGWVGRAAAGGGVACARIRGRWTGWSAGVGGVDRRGGAFPRGLFGMDVYIKPMKAVLGRSRGWMRLVVDAS